MPAVAHCGMEASGTKRLCARYALLLAPDEFTGDDGELHPALHSGFVEGRVFAARMKFRRIEHIGLVGIEADEIGGRADREPALRQA